MDETIQGVAIEGGQAALTQVDFSALGLFLQADIVVKLVILLLVAASIWSWAIMIDKTRLIRRLKAHGEAFEEQFWSADSLEGFYRSSQKASHPYAQVFAAGLEEWQRSAGIADRDGALQRLNTAMRVTFEREMDALEARITFLATLGAVAPFVGLFGTVWGIMRSFTAIAQTQNTTLAVVAPGIAEALFATAIGLAAAIPAVIGYNRLQNEIGRYGGRIANFCEEFQAMLSRQTIQNGD